MNLNTCLQNKVIILIALSPELCALRIVDSPLQIKGDVLTEKKDEETVTINKSTFYHVIIGVLLVALVASIFTGGFGLKLLNNGTATGTTTGTAVPSPIPLAAPSALNAQTASEAFTQYAELSGVDKAKFQGCLDSNKYIDEVNKDLNDGQVAGVSGTPTFFIGTRDGKAKTLVGAQPYSTFKNVIDGLLQNPNSADGAIEMKGLFDDDPKLGSDSAPIVIVEFSDFQCPFCAKFYSDSFGKIKKDYVDTGKVQLIYRDFPLGFHQNAEKAALASQCADEQGKWEQMHDLIFQKQNQWANLG